MNIIIIRVHNHVHVVCQPRVHYYPLRKCTVYSKVSNGTNKLFKFTSVRWQYVDMLRSFLLPVTIAEILPTRRWT